VALAALAAPRLANGIDLIKAGAVFKYHKGTKDASSPRSAWLAVDFDNSSWLRGKTPFFNNEKVDGGTELGDMQSKYSTVYLSRKFRVADPAVLGVSTLRVKADDGYVAWLNGVEIASLHKPTSTLRYSSQATKSNREPINWHVTTLHNMSETSEKGWNVLSVMLLNFRKSNSDAYLDDPVGAILAVLGAEEVGEASAVASSLVGDVPAGCVSAMGTAAAGFRYAEVAQSTGGVEVSICATDFTPLLETLGEASISYQQTFTLSRIPLADSVRVAIDDVAQTEGFVVDYEAATVTFDDAPAPGAAISVSYLVGNE
jgi:hypothetical protein